MVIAVLAFIFFLVSVVMAVVVVVVVEDVYILVTIMVKWCWLLLYWHLSSP